METKKIFIVLGIIVLIAIGYFYLYAKGLGAMYAVGSKPDESPFFITTQPIMVKNIRVPKDTKITYKKQYFWEKKEQTELLKEKNILKISFNEVIYWGEVPITSIEKFFNPKMIGFNVNADFTKLNKNKETPFSNLWQSCNSALAIQVKDINDWSFNKENISDIQGCGRMNRYFSEDIKQQNFLNDLNTEMREIKD
ncbi:hypothetical protein [Lacinutrix sp. MEBiC02595]